MQRRIMVRLFSFVIWVETSQCVVSICINRFLFCFGRALIIQITRNTDYTCKIDLEEIGNNTIATTFFGNFVGLYSRLCIHYLKNNLNYIRIEK